MCDPAIARCNQIFNAPYQFKFVQKFTDHPINLLTW